MDLSGGLVTLVKIKLSTSAGNRMAILSSPPVRTLVITPTVLPRLTFWYRLAVNGW